MKRNQHKLLNLLKRTVLTVPLSLCLLSAMLPISVLASALGIQSAMSCCKGKGQEHCHAQIKKSPPKQELMCGLDTTRSATENDLSQNDEIETDRGTAVNSSVRNSCTRECSGCAVSSSQKQKRDGERPVIRVPHPTSAFCFLVDTWSLGYTSLQKADPFSPRGPPLS